MSCNSSLPPPIRDPSGKIYIAIPAPSFVFAQDASPRAQALNSALGYVYVEYNSNGPHGLTEGPPTPERNELTDMKPSVSIDNWMIKSCDAEPPPGHIPWIGEVSSSDERLYINLPSPSLVPSVLANSSISSFEIPSISSGDTLLDGSLPSTCSSAWSGGILPPHVSVARASTESCRSKSTPASEKKQKARSTIKAPDNRRYTICVPAVSKRREAHVFNRRRTLAKTEKVQSVELSQSRRTLSRNKIMSQINDLDDFFSEGLKKMDLTMSRINEGQKKVEPPTLVVSTSSAIRRVSLESYGSPKAGTPSLAQRRGKDVPVALKLDNLTGLTPLASDYPDIPTAFRGSPDPASNMFFEAPKYPTISLDTKMTTEQMICSLRDQVESFYPRRSSSEGNSDTFVTQCKNAEVWLEDELGRSPCKGRVSSNGRKHGQASQTKKGTSRADDFRDDDMTVLPYMFPLPPGQIEPAGQVKSPRIMKYSQDNRVLSPKANVVRLPTDNLKNWNSKTQTPKTKPRKSILSNGSASSSSSAKKVRFSDTSPSVILPFKNMLQEVSISTSPTKRKPITSPKRKPVPPLGSIKSPVAPRNSFPSTPTKSSVVRKHSPLNSITRSTVPAPISRSPLKQSVAPAPSRAPEKPTLVPRPRNSSPFKKAPLIFSSAANASANKGKGAEDDSPMPKKPIRPMSVGSSLKENRERSLSDKFATITKRRSYAVGANNADKENRKDPKLAERVACEAQKKGGRRSLPFQSMLSRLRG